MRNKVKASSVLATCLAAAMLAACGTAAPSSSSIAQVPPSVAQSSSVVDDSSTPTSEPEGVVLEELSDGMVIGEVSEARMEFQGISRRYMYYIPSTFTGKRMPVVLALHGSGGNAAIQMEAGNYAEIAEREGFIVVAPNAVVVLPIGDERATYRNFSAEGLNMFDIADVYGDMALHYARPAVARTDPAVQAGIDDPAFYEELIKFYSDAGFADTNRVFATGHSHGGFMSLRLAYQYSSVYAGAASIAGLLMGEFRELPAPENQIKLVFINSANDTVVPPAGMVYSPSISLTEDGVWAMPLEDSMAYFMEQYGLGALTQTDTKQLDPLSEFDTTRVTRNEYNNGAAIQYWFTGKDFETGGVGHAWPDSPSDSTNFSQYQATDLFWPDLKIELLEEVPAANITDNILTISVQKVYDNGKEATVTATFPVDGDVSETYTVDDCQIQVTVTGGEVTECVLVS